jgi:hypothetical protein
MSSEAYLRHATAAEDLARQTADPHERRVYLDIAGLWRALAARAAEAGGPDRASETLD